MAGRLLVFKLIVCKLEVASVILAISAQSGLTSQLLVGKVKIVRETERDVICDVMTHTF
jgi:hypothetical protein